MCAHGPHDFIYPIFSYQNKKVHTVIHSLKYDHVHSLVPILTSLMHEILQDTLMHSMTLSNEPLYILSVPDMKKHTRARGINHIQKMAHSLQKCNPLQYILLETCIIRTNTTPQRGLTRTERLTNMQNAFKVVGSDSLKNKTIIIIDDVCTTGSTLVSLRNICMENGAKKIISIVLAH